jgi:hypothetical protein
VQRIASILDQVEGRIEGSQHVDVYNAFRTLLG